MHLITPRLCTALTVFTSLIISSFAIDTPATKDSTILRSTVSCPTCPDRNCYKCTLGHDGTLQANTGGLAYIRSLIAFQLPVPAASITACTVQFSAFTKPLEAPVNVTAAQALSSDWDEDTVTGENAPDAGDVFAEIEVPAYANMGAIDVTPACKGADEDGKFSIFLGTKFGRIEVWSKDSGNPAILHITSSA
ncbi:hypothetical protein ANOM_003784 [Aspergillus nomiae NRRL 13137]|uniref:Carbohydrate-binding module family 96 domain-containing protein n=1 Tax=Aspergillus nomiae NRRL (strain ATCC 15546 / NRRL 13137 / CBS 260.88 / M93) TaxID=1509407 RepID=A0A0L1J611_ASPN3|nr:uncharacterized protein ANOM_003784 [Aspergillus nomiae NRRL 13137]KNG87174.1 hypothetical protein ANOM_003784 [Aspergillus nomiae NRRL 13137]